MKQSTVDYLKWKVGDLNDQIQECHEKLAGDYTYYYQWGYADDLYRLQVQKKHLSNMIKALEQNNSKTEAEWLEFWKERFLEELLEGRIVGSSTSVSSNRAQQMDMEVRQIVLKDIMQIQRWAVNDAKNTKS